MSYYDLKAKANRLIDQLIQENKTEDEIFFKISTMFGFGRKVVKERVELFNKIRGQK